MEELMKVLILTTVRAPYRIKLFEMLGKKCDLTVCFETKSDSIRNEKWYLQENQNFSAVKLKKWEKGSSKIHWDMLSILKQKRPDIILLYEYSTKTSFVVMIMAKLLRIPYLINCDGAFINDHWLKSRLKRTMIKNADGLLAGSDSAKEYFMHYGGREAKIYSHNFTSVCEDEILDKVVSVSYKSDLRRELGLPDKKIAVSVGNFVENKGFIELLGVWNKMEQEFYLLIIGSGEQKDKYLDIIQAKNIKNVRILDFMKYEELKKFYMASDLFVLNTKGDVWGLVINESMSCGLPVITTDKCIAGIELVVNGQNGYLVHIGDEEELEEKIKLCFTNDKKLKTMSENSLKTIRGYTIENITESHIQTFINVLRNRKSK